MNHFITPYPTVFFFLSGDHWLFSESVRLFLFGKEFHLYPFLVPSYKWYIMLISLPVTLHLTCYDHLYFIPWGLPWHSFLLVMAEWWFIVYVPHLLYSLWTSLSASIFSILRTVSLSFRVPLLCKRFLRLIQSCFLSFGSFFIILGTLGGIDVAACPLYCPQIA